jgi:hypothetical protein
MVTKSLVGDDIFISHYRNMLDFKILVGVDNFEPLYRLDRHVLTDRDGNDTSTLCHGAAQRLDDDDM